MKGPIKPGMLSAPHIIPKYDFELVSQLKSSMATKQTPTPPYILR